MGASQLPTLRRASASPAADAAPGSARQSTAETTPADTRAPTARRSTADTTPADARAPTARRSSTAEHPLVLGRYQLNQRLGAGGFGVVWMAHDERLHREVAIKILPRERVVGGRFEREARAAARVTHPGIVTLYEAVVDDEGAYLVSELVRGATLHDLLVQGLLSDRDIVAITLSLCDALAHAHEEGIIHRDVKPSNILVPERPSSPAHPAKLTDFGVARLVGGEALTHTGDVIGTAAYMAPEQAEGLPAGPAADLYALALVTYEALTGVNPVRTGSAAIRARRLGAHLPPLRRQRRDLPRALGQGIDLALRPRSRERGTIAELGASLATVLTALDDTPGVVAGPRLRPRRDGSPPQELEQRGLQFVDAPERGRRGRATDLARDEEARRREATDLRRRSAPEPDPDAPLPIPRPHPFGRCINAAAAALACGWLTVHALGGPVPAQAAAFAAVIAVLLLPRIGWLAVSTALVGGALLGGRTGVALLLLTLFAPLAVIPRSGGFWALPAGAPALGLLGLAGAWPAIAAQASRSLWRRAALGALGWLWLVAAAQLHAGHLAAAAPVAAGPQAWLDSGAQVWTGLLLPLLRSGVFAPALAWAAAAGVLPWLIRRASLAADAVAVALWSGALLLATDTLTGSGTGSRTIAKPVTALVAVLVGALCALAPSIVATRSRPRRAAGSQPELA